MNEGYELWDVDSGNLVGYFDDLDTAVTFLRTAVDEHGADVLEGFMLAPFPHDRDPIADGELLALVAGQRRAAEAVA